MDISIARFSWYSLPAEIRLLVLECIIPQYGCIETTADRGFARESVLATVSIEWQCFFEKQTFRRMTLVSSDLPAFVKAVRGKNAIRLNYMTHLHLHIELAAYTDRIYDKPESAVTVSQNNRAFTYAIAGLLHALSFWEGNQGGLVLEINAHSPSDQWFHRAEFEVHDDYMFRFEEDLERSPGYFEYHRRKTDELRGTVIRQNMTLRHSTSRRLRGTPLDFQQRLFKKLKCYGSFICKLPEAPVVKGLLLRREFFRGIGFTSLARLLYESFVALESVRLDRWVEQTKAAEIKFWDALKMHLIPGLSASVKRFSCSLTQRWDSDESWPMHEITVPMFQFLATSCHRFTEFCPPVECNVRVFLRQLISNRTCKGCKLQHLCLRSFSIRPSRSQEWVTNLLVLAGRAAKKLPRLQTLELWNSGREFGYLFRYTQNDCRATITWRWTRPGFVLAPKVLEVWARTASTRTLSVESVPFSTRAKDGLGPSILHHLALRRLACDPITEARLVAQHVARRRH